MPQTIRTFGNDLFSYILRILQGLLYRSELNLSLEYMLNKTMKRSDNTQKGSKNKILKITVMPVEKDSKLSLMITLYAQRKLAS